MTTRIYSFVLAIGLILFGAMPSSAQTFLKYYDDAAANRFSDVAVLNNGNIICVGVNNMAPPHTPIIVTYDGDGNVLNEWPADSATAVANQSYLWDVYPTNDGGFVASGGMNTPYGMVIYKFDDRGDLAWKFVGDTIDPGWNPWSAKAIVPATDGGFVAACWALDGQGNDDSYIIKVDAQGDSVWSTRLYGVVNQSVASDIVNTPDGGYLVTGISELFPSLNVSPYVVKLDSLGNIEWNRVYGETRSAEPKIAAMNNGNYVIFSENDFTVQPNYAWAITINELGDSLGTTIYQKPDTNIRITNMVPDNNGGFIIVGGVRTVSNPASVTVMLMKTDDQLQEVWSEYYKVHGDIIWGLGVSNSPGTGYLVSGFNTDNNKAILIRTDSVGHIAYSVVRGTVISDANENCLDDTGEFRLPNRVIEVVSDRSYYGYSDTNGEYSIKIYDTTQATIYSYPNNPYWTQSACQGNGFTVNLPGNDTLDQDIFLDPIIDCPALTVNVFMPGVTRCTPQLINVQYCNNGTMPASNVYVELQVDEYITVDSATIPWDAALPNNTYRWNLGGLHIGECNSFSVFGTVSCDTNTVLLGQTHCVEAHIYPDSICLPPDPLWDGSSLRIQSACLPGDTIEFTIYNEGVGDMDGPSYFIIAEDNVMYKRDNFKLNAGEFLVEKIPGNGKTYTMIVPQSNGHPGYSHPLKSVEGCGRDSSGSFSRGFVTQFPLDDEDNFIDITCVENSNAIDPNDKTPEPKGISNQGYIANFQPLGYRIRFQNTGTDTAHLVIIRDTLPDELDITTLYLTGASHAYDFRISESNILVWTFRNIELPDSNVNEPASHGYVSFHIQQKQGNTPGTQISNRAGIYFDFNLPVMTNYTLNTIATEYKDLLYITVEERSGPENQVKLYPNPSQGVIYLEMEQPVTGDVQFELYDLAGRQLQQFHYTGQGQHAVNLQDMETGVYLYRVQVNGKTLGNGKILLTR